MTERTCQLSSTTAKGEKNVSIESAFERKEQELEDALNRGDITPQEFNKQMRNLQHEYRNMVEDEAQDAYNQVYNRHYDRW